MKLSQKQLNLLKRLGLSDVQTKMYIASLEHGMLTALELSKLTKLSRQKIYDEAEKLVDLGLYDITRKQGRKYIPAHPSKLLALGQVQISELQSTLGDIGKLIPILESGEVSKKNEVKIKYYEGKDRVTKAYQDELDACHNVEVLYLAGSIDDILTLYSEEYWDAWNKQFVKQGSSSKMLAHDTRIARQISLSDKKHGRETRFLKKFTLKSNIDIFGDTVLIVSYYDELAIWIESKILADSFRIMFGTLWEIAEESCVVKKRTT